MIALLGSLKLILLIIPLYIYEELPLGKGREMGSCEQTD